MSEQLKTVTVSEIKQLDDKDIIKSIEGRLTKLFDSRKGGEGDRQWEFQDGEFTDSTGTMKISFAKCTQDKSAIGKPIKIESYKHETHGWLGLKVEDGDYVDKKSGEKVKKRQIRVTATAKIKYNGTSDEIQLNKLLTSESPPSSKNTIKHPNEILDDLVELHKACYFKTGAIYGADHKDLAAITACIYIEANRTFGLQYDSKKRLSQKPTVNYPPPPKDTDDWDVCVIPSGSLEGKTLKTISDEDLLRLFEYYDSKQSNTKFAECVYAAARDRGVLVKEEDKPPDINEPADDDLPF